MQKKSSLRAFVRTPFFLLVCTVLCFVLAFFISGKEDVNFGAIAKKFEKKLHIKETHASEELQELFEKTNKWTYAEVFSEKHEYYESLFEREGLVFLVFEKGSLQFWTDNTVVVDNYLLRNDFYNKVVKLPNGWFEIIKHSEGKKELFALLLLKREYAYQNKYLANEFQRDFHINSDVEIRVLPGERKETNDLSKDIFNEDIYDKDGAYLCTLSFLSENSVSRFLFYLSVIFSILGLFFVHWFLQASCDKLVIKTGKAWAHAIFFISVIVLRYVGIELKFPRQFYETKLFSPELYGDASYVWLSSLGDMLINTILVFYLVFYIYRNIQISSLSSAPVLRTVFGAKENEQGSRRGEWIAPFFLLSIVFFASGIINYIFPGIIRNSSIPFTLNDIFSQNSYTYLSLVIISLLFVSYFLILDKTAEYIKRVSPGTKKLIVTFLPAAALFILVSHLIGTVDMILVFWPLFLFAFILWRKQKKSSYSFSVIVMLLFIVSFFSAHVILKFSDRKENQSRIALAQKLSAEQDPLAEHLFGEIESALSTDSSLINLLGIHDHRSQQGISYRKTENFKRQLIAKYFSGYWEKYEIRISVFDTACYPLVHGSLLGRDNLNYFERIIASDGMPTMSKGFFYLTNSEGRISYLARVPLTQVKDFSFYRIGDMYIEFDSRVISAEMGFPELMLDQKLGIVQDLLDYSYAKYKNGKMISYYGKFPYSLSAKSFLNALKEENYFLPKSENDSAFFHASFYEMDGWNHLPYMADDNSLVVISKKDEGRIAVVTTFSYLFAFFSLVLLFLLLLRIIFLERNIRIDSFRLRIQYVLVFMVLFSLLFFGAGTIYYIDQQYDAQTRQTVRDKMVSALVQATQELGYETDLKHTKSAFFSYLLKRMSNVFLTDISLYDKEGDLIGSSQMKMFEEGLMSKKMSPEAYYQLAIKQGIEFIHDEKIGQLKYLSAYCSLRNDSGDLLGYLNIPYFARQSELEKEISTILAAIINIYVLLFVISVIFALAISDYFAKPLKLIQSKLSSIKLGKAGEPIEWKSKDEIGSLINEYNRMIDELQKSALLLARSERETAWREMAKQVAHEIKNPLTPMKLSIQHLQRTWKNKDEDMDKKIERITATVIEQIDTLSTIAGEFANFAKMPVTVNEKINMRTILENAILLFKDSTDTEIVFNTTLEDAFIFADKEQMLRVCNNLLKNALQAIPENRKGKIEIFLTKQDGFLLLKIKDNGTGISEDKMSKIFFPNFTTKTGGMGLGLAMVKSSVETFGGKIWFETSMQTGTTFFVSIPEYNKNV